MQDFLLFLCVGFLAQVVDGALGMAYGVISSTVLLSFGVPPATASASVHAAEVFTTAASAGSHTVNRNVNWKLFTPLALGGVVGGGLGAFVLTSIDGDLIKPWITAYLAVMGVVIIWRATRQTRERLFPRKFAGPLGLVGGFFDAIGGGGWGPTVTTTLVGSGQDPRASIGTTNTAEFFVTSAISATSSAINQRIIVFAYRKLCDIGIGNIKSISKKKSIFLIGLSDFITNKYRKAFYFFNIIKEIF